MGGEIRAGREKQHILFPLSSYVHTHSHDKGAERKRRVEDVKELRELREQLRRDLALAIERRAA